MERYSDNRYRIDARWITAKCPGTDANGRRFDKGERVFYFPALREIISGERAEQASHQLQSNGRLVRKAWPLRPDLLLLT